MNRFKTYLSLLPVSISLMLLACNRDNQNKDVFLTGALEGEGDGGAQSEDSSSQSSSSNTDDATSPAHGDSEGEDKSRDQGESGGNEGDSSSHVPRFDVPQETDRPDECKNKDAGVYCRDDRTSIECNGEGKRTYVDICPPGICAEGLGCVVCREGQTGCIGNRVMQCDTSVKGHRWEEIAECDAGAEQVCDHKTGSCIDLSPTGSDVPTGKYYRFSRFSMEDEPRLEYAADIDSYDNRLYISSRNGPGTGANIAVFELELLDSDGDGKLEPNQHPDNPEARGPIEERLLTYTETISIDSDAKLFNSSSEIYVTEGKLYYAGWIGSFEKYTIVEYDLETGTTNFIHPPKNYELDKNNHWGIETIGFDEINKVWYAGFQFPRAVMQYDEFTNTWGYAFAYPDLAGNHMDGLEVVTTRQVDNEGRITYGIPYVYVSDMMSDFIGQYRLDPEEGWIQENLFEYNDEGAEFVEGMGFGALNHFWVASGEQNGVVYELGGGDLARYVEPVN